MTKEKLRYVIGENIRNARMKKGMNIHELAKEMGITSNFLGLIERGRRGANATNLLKISQVFDIKIDQLFEPLAHEIADAPEKRKMEKLRSKIYSLVCGFSEDEMNYVVDITKGLRALNQKTVMVDEEEE